jgi:acetate kinase
MLWDIVSFMVELVSLVHVDEMVEEKNHTAFQLAPLTIQRTWKGIHVASAILHRQNKWLFFDTAFIKQFLYRP